MDAVVVGAGHNGLVAAGYLARAGLRVTVVEARPLVGGACVTEELIPGFRFSSAAVVLSLLWPKIVRDLELRRFGLHYFRTGVDRIGIWENGKALVLYPELDRQLRALSRFARRDASGLVALGIRLRRFAALIEPTALRPPPSLERFRSLFHGPDAGLFEEFVLGSIRDTVSRYFGSPEVAGLFAFPGLVSVDASPDTPGTAYVYGHHSVGGLDGQLGAHGYVRGGMGGVTQALARSAEASGASILAGTPVERILLEDGRAVGVALADGREVLARAVVSNADPHRTMLVLVGAERLDRDFAEAICRLDYGGTMARVYLALSELPRYQAAPHEGAEPADVHSAFTLLGADLDSYARAHSAQRRGELFPDPVLELTIPTTHDDSLAPAGMHTMTLGVMHVPRELASGSWDDRREAFGDLVVDRLAAFAPNVRGAIVDRRVATPPDLERTFGLTGGNIFHGAMSPEQLFASRPLPGWSSYRMPVQNLYLCGSGTHPGGAVSGAPGHNAAHALLEDARDGPLGPAEWLERAHREGELPPRTSRGRALHALVRSPQSQWAVEAFARRRISRPVVRRLTTTRR